MLKLKTIGEFPVQRERVIENKVIRMAIQKMCFDANNVVIEGFYYFRDTDNQIVVLSKINLVKLKEDLTPIQYSVLAPLESSWNIFDNLQQRLHELTMVQLQLEAGQNFGTNQEDWIIDTDVFEPIQP